MKMRQVKRLARPHDEPVTVVCPLTDDELLKRQTNYSKMTPKQFATSQTFLYHRPVTLIANGVVHQIAINSCDNPFCSWYGLSQAVLSGPLRKRSRYNVGSGKGGPDIRCQPDPTEDRAVVLNCSVKAKSNWSLADEIARLLRAEMVVSQELDRQYHNSLCTLAGTTPFTHRQHFVKRGKREGSNAQRWQCRCCNKITSSAPDIRENMTYQQKRSEINRKFFVDVVSREPIRRSAEGLKMHPQTYYRKLEMLYRRCLEFLEHHERRALAQHDFSNLNVGTDELIYNINYIRRRGSAAERKDWGRKEEREKRLKTLFESADEEAGAAINRFPCEGFQGYGPATPNTRCHKRGE